MKCPDTEKTLAADEAVATSAESSNSRDAPLLNTGFVKASRLVSSEGLPGEVARPRPSFVSASQLLTPSLVAQPPCCKVGTEEGSSRKGIACEAAGSASSGGVEAMGKAIAGDADGFGGGRSVEARDEGGASGGGKEEKQGGLKKTVGSSNSSKNKKLTEFFKGCVACIGRDFYCPLPCIIYRVKETVRKEAGVDTNGPTQRTSDSLQVNNMPHNMPPPPHQD